MGAKFALSAITAFHHPGDMKAQIDTIPHQTQRYPTVGDWFTKEGTLQINVSQLPDWRYEALVAIHELIEAVLCKQAGVTELEIDTFDVQYEANRKPEDIESEPGDDPNAPYQRQHGIATGIERILAAELGVKWDEYADVVEALP